MARIGWGYYQGVPGWIVPYADPEAWYLMMDPGDRQPHAGHWVGRVPTQGDGWEWDCVTRGRRGAEDFANHCLPWWQKARDWILMWAGITEPPADTVEQAVLLSDFHLALRPLARAAGIEIAGGGFARGTPNPAILEHYGPMVVACNGRILVHEYGFADMRAPADVGYHCLRYKALLVMARQTGLRIRMVASELGQDNNAGGGWQWYKTAPAQYAEQLRWWAEQTQADPEMLGGIIFAASSYSFPSFLINAEVARAVRTNNDALATPAQEASVGVTAFSQRDPSWSGIALGSGGGLTIGQAGCLLCAVASALADLSAIHYTPLSLNQWLLNHGGYASGNQFVWSALAPLGLRLASFVECPLVPAPVDAMRQALAAGQAVIVEVDAEPGGEVQMHWVRLLAIDADGRDAQIMDPWQVPGEEVSRLSEHYEAAGWDVGRAVMRVAVYVNEGGG